MVRSRHKTKRRTKAVRLQISRLRYDFNWPINCEEKMVAAVAEIAHVSVFLFRDNIIFLILNSNNL